MAQKWITKKSGDENRHVKIETGRKPREKSGNAQDRGRL